MKRAIAAIALGLATGGGALAADLPVKAPVPQVAAGPAVWVGLEALYMTQSTDRFEFARHNGTDQRFFADQDRDWKPGARFTVGVAIDPLSSIEMSGFFLTGTGSSATARAPTDSLDARFLGTAVGYPGVNINPTIGGTAIDIFSASRRIDVNLNSEIWGAEGNYRRRIATGLPNVRVDVLAGLRYVHLGSTMNVFSDDDGTGAVWLGYLNVSARNDLYGAQLGFDARYDFNSAFSLGLVAKGGIFADNISRNRVMNTINGAGVFANVYNDTVSATNFAGLVEISPTLIYKVGARAEVFAGYQALWLTGVSQAQHYYLNAGLVEDRSVPTSSVLFHGARAGLKVGF